MVLLNTLQQKVPCYSSIRPSLPHSSSSSHQPHPLLLLFYLTGSKVFSSCSLLTVIVKAIVNILLKSFLVSKMKTNSNFKTKLVSNSGRILEVSIWHTSQLHPQTVIWQKVQIINAGHFVKGCRTNIKEGLSARMTVVPRIRRNKKKICVFFSIM